MKQNYSKPKQPLTFFVTSILSFFGTLVVCFPVFVVLSWWLWRSSTPVKLTLSEELSKSYECILDFNAQENHTKSRAQEQGAIFDTNECKTPSNSVSLKWEPLGFEKDLKLIPFNKQETDDAVFAKFVSFKLAPFDFWKKEVKVAQTTVKQQQKMTNLETPQNEQDINNHIANEIEQMDNLQKLHNLHNLHNQEGVEHQNNPLNTKQFSISHETSLEDDSLLAAASTQLTKSAETVESLSNLPKSSEEKVLNSELTKTTINAAESFLHEDEKLNAKLKDEQKSSNMLAIAIQKANNEPLQGVTLATYLPVTQSLWKFGETNKEGKWFGIVPKALRGSSLISIKKGYSFEQTPWDILPETLHLNTEPRMFWETVTTFNDLLRQVSEIKVTQQKTLDISNPQGFFFISAAILAQNPIDLVSPKMAEALKIDLKESESVIFVEVLPKYKPRSVVGLFDPLNCLEKENKQLKYYNATHVRPESRVETLSKIFANAALSQTTQSKEALSAAGTTQVLRESFTALQKGWQKTPLTHHFDYLIFSTCNNKISEQASQYTLVSRKGENLAKGSFDLVWRSLPFDGTLATRSKN